MLCHFRPHGSLRFPKLPCTFSYDHWLSLILHCGGLSVSLGTSSLGLEGKPGSSWLFLPFQEAFLPSSSILMSMCCPVSSAAASRHQCGCGFLASPKPDPPEYSHPPCMWRCTSPYFSAALGLHMKSLKWGSASYFLRTLMGKSKDKCVHISAYMYVYACENVYLYTYICK